MAFCPSARFLARLTDPQVGFPHLRFLDLYIRTDFIDLTVDDGSEDRFLDVVSEAGFTLRARKVRLTVTNTAGLVAKVHSEVKKRISVVN